MKIVYLCWWLLAAAGIVGCTFNFELTSQRTALENQVMGSYRELEDDLVLAASARSSVPPARPGAEKKPAIDARQNQEFNRDDIDELKSKQLIGETRDGALAILPPAVAGEARKSASRAEITLAASLTDEENRDRAVIWQRIIAGNENLSAKDLPEVRRTYAKMQREQADAGQWYEDEAGRWQRKNQTAVQ